MISTIRCNRIIVLLFGITSISASGIVLADPPTRVARLGYAGGAVSYSPAGENDWVAAPLNLPLITGDRLWADSGAQDELQIGSAAIRMGGNTSMTILNLDDRVAQLQLSQGTLNVHVRRLGRDEVFEIDTPNLAFSLLEPGDYRIDVDPDGNATTLAVRRGQGEADGEGAAYMVEAGQSYRFAGAGLRDYQYQALPPADEFDRWSAERDRRVENSASARYVSRDMIGYEDLDDHGSWRTVSGYGNVWMPSHVAADWAPYRDGHWAWVDPWGWTWVDDAPWGFAVSHYGRWVNMNNNWGWVPGPIAARPVYAPALVAFVGGSGFHLAISGGNVAGVAWFPLGPQDVYRPSYKVSLNYFANINTSSTTVNRTNITNVYNNINVTNITYINRTVPGAVVAVPATAFSRSQPVSKSAVSLTKDEIGKAPVVTVAAVAPVAASVKGASAPAHTPPAVALMRAVVVKTAPPAAPVPFTSRQAAMAANPGRPLDTAALANIKPAVSLQTPQIKLVHPAPVPVPMSKAPASVPASKAMPAAGAVMPLNKQEHAAPAVGSEPHLRQSAVEAPQKPALAIPLVPAQAVKPPERPAPAHPPEAPPKNADVSTKVVPSAPRVRAAESEPLPHQVIKPPESVLPEHAVPPRQPMLAPASTPKEAQPREPLHEPKDLPAPSPQTRGPVGTPAVAHPSAAPVPKQDAVKHEEQRAGKGGEKKAEEDRQRKD